MGKVSRALNTLLRHWGCSDDSSLACDSGGWYLIDDIIEVIRPKRPGIPKPRWVIILEENLAENKSYERQRILSFTADDWRKVIFASIVPGRADRPRFQALIERINGSLGKEALRPLAIRAANGHSLIDILDPERIAAKVPSRIGMYIAGVFHVTTWDKLESIFRKRIASRRSFNNNAKNGLALYAVLSR
jgi:RNA:NAD 2'-phosphotransferase (TPT1/KptA family)